MATQKEIRKQYSAEDLALMKRLGIDPPDLEDVAENIAANCAPWQPAPEPFPASHFCDDDEDESAEDCEEDEEDEEDESDDSPTAFVDFRLKLRRSGYVLNVGSPDYDQDGRGPTGCASIRIDESNDPEKLAEVARELVDSALEEAAQGYTKKDIAA
jgi:hypothetical protein